jgi:hypothetical protein
MLLISAFIAVILLIGLFVVILMTFRENTRLRTELRHYYPVPGTLTIAETHEKYIYIRKALEVLGSEFGVTEVGSDIFPIGKRGEKIGIGILTAFSTLDSSISSIPVAKALYLLVYNLAQAAHHAKELEGTIPSLQDKIVFDEEGKFQVIRE